ncbi:unnamed protein product [Pelagomonas calceolata]|uniref:Band 3 cytoplasmic domain-containing protein n=1 Tax=Pelagomonas calceolata TaxID=35677 RepID=A0A8J2SVG1_9STRA|nr:unnamed protein product [Pelagomonas calceolata]|mmetsp:Transcript_8533/g.24259  ORF Transcript_8533/g.24259 Transcript_8533/m.24259 type:complete len:1103 (-) Transcript_8533:25-3333(-)
MEETKAPHHGRPPLYVRPPTPPPGSTPPPADNIMDSRPPPPPLPALTLGPSVESEEIREDKEKELNLTMFKKKHLFVELHELRGDEWHETKRYNYGLEEDLITGKERKWTKAHLPSISIFGMLAFRDCLHEDLVILDVGSQDDDSRRALEPVALEIVEHLIRDGALHEQDRDGALRTLTNHLNRRKCVEHDDELKALKEKERKLREAEKEGELQKLPRGPLETLGEDDEVASQSSFRRSRSRNRSLTNLFGAGKSNKSLKSLDDSEHDSCPPASRDLDKVKKQKSDRLKAALVQAEDTLKPDAEEEAVHILIDDDFAFTTQDVVALVRLRQPTNTGLEEHVDIDELEADSSPLNSPLNSPARPGLKPRRKNRHQQLHARFIVLVLGRREGVITSEYKRKQHDQHVEMGAAAAAMLQDDSVVQVAYNCSRAKDLLDAIDHRLKALRVLPQTSRPSSKTVDRRAKRIFDQLAKLKEEEENEKRRQEQEKKEREAIARGEILDENHGEIVSRRGGVFLRVAFPDQKQKFLQRQQDVFTRGVSLASILVFVQKYALPLILGICVALVAKNTSPNQYERWAGAASHRRRLFEGEPHPTLFGLSVHGHDVTLHFLINDVLMTLFFGLAVKEIAEAFQPGGSLYPPGRRAVNPLCGTVGGVVGPILAYFVILWVFTSSGMIAEDFEPLSKGWGIPTATDISIAWVAAVCVFGVGHAAINYLLLCAVVDDGIGLIIIAVAYPSEGGGCEYGYLGLVLAAMVVAYVLRRFKCSRWEAYVVLAGPLAWCGLLWSCVHPSLALVFVVPFMPIEIEPDEEEDAIMKMVNSFAKPQAALSPGNLAYHETKDEEHSHLSPLHDFEESVKGFVDFFVLFAFGAVNAGVDVGETGGFSFVVLLGLLIGKTLGMTAGSLIASYLGFDRPEGMQLRHLVLAGVISSVGLTVSLFIAGEAFPDDAKWESQAKMGALLSAAPVFVLGALASCSHSFRDLVRGLDEKKDDDIEKQSTVRAPSEHSDSESRSESMSLGTNVMPEVDEQDEDLEAVVVSNIEASLLRIQRLESKIEERIGLSRSVSIDKLHEHQDEVRRRSFGHALGSASMTVPEARRVKSAGSL